MRILLSLLFLFSPTIVSATDALTSIYSDKVDDPKLLQKVSDELTMIYQAEIDAVLDLEVFIKKCISDLNNKKTNNTLKKMSGNKAKKLAFLEKHLQTSGVSLRVLKRARKRVDLLLKPKETWAAYFGNAPEDDGYLRKSKLSVYFITEFTRYTRTIRQDLVKYVLGECYLENEEDFFAQVLSKANNRAMSCSISIIKVLYDALFSIKNIDLSEISDALKVAPAFNIYALGRLRKDVTQYSILIDGFWGDLSKDVDNWKDLPSFPEESSAEEVWVFIEKNYPEITENIETALMMIHLMQNYPKVYTRVVTKHSRQSYDSVTLNELFSLLRKDAFEEIKKLRNGQLKLINIPKIIQGQRLDFLPYLRSDHQQENEEADEKESASLTSDQERAIVILEKSLKKLSGGKKKKDKIKKQNNRIQKQINQIQSGALDAVEFLKKNDVCQRQESLSSSSPSKSEPEYDGDDDPEPNHSSSEEALNIKRIKELASRGFKAVSPLKKAKRKKKTFNLDRFLRDSFWTTDSYAFRNFETLFKRLPGALLSNKSGGSHYKLSLNGHVSCVARPHAWAGDRLRGTALKSLRVFITKAGYGPKSDNNQ